MSCAWLLATTMLYLFKYYFQRVNGVCTMANPEYVKILMQDIEAWNKWREGNSNIRPNFIDADLSGANLNNANLTQTDLIQADFIRTNLIRARLRGADLRGANLSDAILIQADLKGANLNGAILSGARLRDANLGGTNLNGADLSSADLGGADFSDADLSGTNLRGANLSGTDLGGARLSHANLSDVNLQHANCNQTIFADIDLSMTTGLDTVEHWGPSTMGMDTFFKSKGKIPEIFLRGCGLPETLITFLPSMLEDAIQFYSCFISYSHADKEFAERFHDRLQGMGIRCWRDEHQFKPGDELHKTIYEGIRVYDKVILCCSESSLKSWWVEKEFKNAISKEEDYTETILIPLSVDGYIYKQLADDWTIGEIKRRFVQDFSNWKDHDAFELAFKKVVAALRTDGGKSPPPTSKLTRR